ncbi:MAG: hypothetical protein XD92_1377, partial [Proteiniphilum acetatigenes]
MELLYLLIGFVAGGLIAWVMATLFTRTKMIPKGDHDLLEEKNQALHRSLAIVTAENRAMMEKMENQKSEIAALHKQFNLEFEQIASRILEEKSERFTRQNRENIDTILKPLEENIDRFRRKVEEVYVTEAKERFSLGEEVKKLRELNDRLSTEAVNLTNALKGNSKT